MYLVYMYLLPRSTFHYQHYDTKKHIMLYPLKVDMENVYLIAQLANRALIAWKPRKWKT